MVWTLVTLNKIQIRNYHLFVQRDKIWVHYSISHFYSGDDKQTPSKQEAEHREDAAKQQSCKPNCDNTHKVSRPKLAESKRDNVRKPKTDIKTKENKSAGNRLETSIASMPSDYKLVIPTIVWHDHDYLKPNQSTEDSSIYLTMLQRILDSGDESLMQEVKSLLIQKYNRR